MGYTRVGYGIDYDFSLLADADCNMSWIYGQATNDFGFAF